MGALHVRAEGLAEAVGGWHLGGGHATAWLDLPLGLAWQPSLYGRAEQAFTSRPDGLHRPDSLYRALTLGLSLPLAWGASLKLESLELKNDDFPVFAGGRIYQGQLQWEL
jgi:hypothetical protein